MKYEDESSFRLAGLYSSSALVQSFDNASHRTTSFIDQITETLKCVQMRTDVL